jgi:hypothetical protein
MEEHPFAPFSFHDVCSSYRSFPLQRDLQCNPDGVGWHAFYERATNAQSGIYSDDDDSKWCLQGHSSRLCANCADGYFSSGRWCLRCLSVAVHVLVLFCNFLLMAALIAYLWLQQPSNATSWSVLSEYALEMRAADSGSSAVAAAAVSANHYRHIAADDEAASDAPSDEATPLSRNASNPLRLLVFHTQQLSLLLLTAGSMPGALAGLLSIFSSAGNSFSLSSLTAMECLASEWSLAHKCWAAIVAPALVGMAAAAQWLGQKNVQAQDPFQRHVGASTVRFSSQVYSVCVSLLYLLVFPCASTALQSLGCTDHSESDLSSAPVYLNLTPWVQCDDYWRWYTLPPAFMAALWWCVIFPIGSTLLLWRLRTQLASAPDVDATAPAPHELSLSTAPASGTSELPVSCRPHLQSWSLVSDLLKPYSARYWYW